MLVLTRSTNESLLIDDDKIMVKVLRINGNQVRLGIEAPRSISIHRDEIYNKIKNGEKQNGKI